MGPSKAVQNQDRQNMKKRGNQSSGSVEALLAGGGAVAGLPSWHPSFGCRRLTQTAVTDPLDHVVVDGMCCCPVSLQHNPAGARKTA
jgi:hypothetical protein